MEAIVNDMFNDLCCGGGGGGAMDCTPVSFVFPPASTINLNNAGPYFITVPLSGTAPYSLISFVTNAPADVLFANITGNILKIGMVPGNTILGVYNVAVRIGNCNTQFQDGAGTIAITKPCVPVSFNIPAVVELNFGMGVAVRNYTLSGTAPFVKIAAGALPYGAFIEVIGNQVAIGANPSQLIAPSDPYDIAISFTIENCSGATRNYIGILRVTI